MKTTLNIGKSDLVNGFCIQVNLLTPIFELWGYKYWIGMTQTRPLSREAVDKSIFLLDSSEKNPCKTLEAGRVMCRAWARSIDLSQQVVSAQSVMVAVISAYWEAIHAKSLKQCPTPTFYVSFSDVALDNSALAVASAIGKAAAKLDVIRAAFELGSVYTSMLPEDLRASNGVFYTPPALTSRLLRLVEDQGIDWSSAVVADPACGGGAFLAPVALKMLKALKGQSAQQQLVHLETHLKGFEIDPFAAWLTQVFVEITTRNITAEVGRPLKKLVTICDTLTHFDSVVKTFDLVIGNPPFGKIKLTDTIRQRYKESLFGHPNLYGLFTHLAIEMTKPGGIVGYVTPTSFLSGEYFKNLRHFIRSRSTPVAIDFVSVRKGVFHDVLQETLLATYRCDVVETDQPSINIHELKTIDESQLVVSEIGKFRLPANLLSPWLLPRSSSQSDLVRSTQTMTASLSSWGFKVSTGQLVWNRHKEQLSDSSEGKSLPIVWAEAVTTNGGFVLKAEKKNHKRWLKFVTGQDFLLTTRPCLLLQRTTSKEQERRLITAVLPSNVIEQYGAVVVENHLNMIVATVDKPFIELKALSRFLNSKLVNDVFRAISGSVAVSAYELESLPLPDPSKMKEFNKLVAQGANDALLEAECLKLYSATSR